MKMIFIAAIAVLASVTQVVAADAPVVLGPAAVPGNPASSCVEVEIGGEKAPGLNCMNEKLRDQAQSARGPVNVPPYDANSKAVSVGGFNQAATAQQFGSNFGKSVVPYRPPVGGPVPSLGGH